MTAPASLTPQTLGLQPSFGFGDRTGLATAGHVAAMLRSGHGISPIFPQQSIREMARTQRTPRQVMDDAMQAARQAGWTGPIGADADHLKTTADVDVTAAVGFTFYTIDPSGAVDQQADNYDEATLEQKFSLARAQAPWFESYVGKEYRLPHGGRLQLDKRSCMRAAVKYGAAIQHAIHLSNYIRQLHETAHRDFEIELSVDETEQPTTLAEHFIIADQCLRGGMKLVSLAPRFIGELEKGVDYKGDVSACEASLADHAAIAKMLGPYKLSLHSGSDKLSIYPALARATAGLFHVKTAGTSYLEALRVVARHEASLFRRIIAFARQCYDRDKATYHVSATLAGVPSPETIGDIHQLESLYLECWEAVPPGLGFTAPGRQILHCTFGSILTDPQLGQALRDVLKAHPDTYQEVLADHFSRHLTSLAQGMS
jgi:hypothetical protein